LVKSTKFYYFINLFYITKRWQKQMYQKTFSSNCCWITSYFPQIETNWETCLLKEWISSTFYVRVFCTKVICTVFSLVTFWQKAHSYKKRSSRTLIKLTLDFAEKILFMSTSHQLCVITKKVPPEKNTIVQYFTIVLLM